MTQTKFSPEDVLDLWFPDEEHAKSMETHGAFWMERMQGGMDAIIIENFADMTLAAAEGKLDHWAETSRGRLALLITLDQFPRSLWRGTPAAYAQDIKATRLALEGIENKHYDPLLPWEKSFYGIAISHCEGPDHMDRMQLCLKMAEDTAAEMPDCLAEAREMYVSQVQRVTGIISRFGRHPHRNEILGRPSTPDEVSYIETGDFPHLAKPDEM